MGDGDGWRFWHTGDLAEDLRKTVSLRLYQGPCDIHVLSWQSPEPGDVLTLQPEQEFVIPAGLSLVITGLSWI